MVAILAGTALGFLSGLGVGGGSLLLLWMTLVMNQPQEIARAVNLMFFVPCALIATICRRKQSLTDRGITLSAIAAGLLGAALGSIIGPNLDTQILKKAFGILFLITGIRELRWRNHNHH